MLSKHCFFTFVATLTIALSTSQPLLLKDQPAEVLFRVGTPLVLECAVESGDSTGAKFEWVSPFRDLKSNHVLQNGQNLMIQETKDNDEGLYQCFANTTDGVATTRQVNVRKTYIKIPQLPHQKIRPVEGRPFQLYCPLVEGYPVPKVEWKKRSVATGKLESFLSPRIFSPQGDLYFSNATNEDVSNEYSFVCLVTSPAVDKPVPVIEWSVEGLTKDDKPADNEVVRQFVSDDKKAVVGDTTEIYCVYGGNPMPRPDWYKDGVNVNNNPGDRVTRHNRSRGKRLLIKETLPEDEGQYTCVVDNGVGAVQNHTMRLTVISPPIFKQKPEGVVTVKEGGTLVLPCEVTTTFSGDVIWTHNANVLSHKALIRNINELKIENVQKSHSGYYGCRVSNAFGQIYSESFVQVL